MTTARRAIGRLVVIIAIALLFFATAGPPAARPVPPGAFAFAALGDAPYYPWEELRFRTVLKALNEHELAHVIHIGDTFWKPCSDAMFRKTLARFHGIRHPLIYTPGDNEWVDCWGKREGGYVPLERLARLRRMFFADPTHSLGRRRIALAHQRELIENARWSHAGVLFATQHIPGSLNATEAFPTRTAADDAGVKTRTEASLRWMREAFAEAKRTNAAALVLAIHANVFPDHADHRHAYLPYVSALEAELATFDKPVLLINGSSHVYLVQQPFPRHPNFTRLQVPGSPDVGWVRVLVRPGSATPWTFENHVVPAWKYW